ncbi:DEAD/DEAH box helicase [Methylocystis sp. ATCC 49242]|uniref:DEAD/DEAH box helicase n=1 Tax=Methylocystis sp. ATCC 49242 TaxID=622637 RepID=UPI0001F868D2|nr:DEAD/DEAH box helicase [Methylocystis sp. ATCC 49242]
MPRVSAKIQSKRIVPPPSSEVSTNLIRTFGDRLHSKSICLTTPVSKLVPLDKGKPSRALREFLKAYEPRIVEHGLYEHQASIVQRLNGDAVPNVLMTTTTGSGKSLAFLAWAFEILRRDPKATVIATFPTQALLWGQADRLAALEARVKGVEAEQGKFSGRIEIDGVELPWSVWYGVHGDRKMADHVETPGFKNARLRLSTLDKVHWSLMGQDQADFLRHLGGLIIDEAHSWHGLSGANVRRMLDRLHLSMDVLGCKQHPAFFLASATLAEATVFAEDLTGVSSSPFLEVSDLGTATASLVATEKVPALLAQKAEPGLLRRYILLIKPETKPLVADKILGESKLLGDKADVLCFVQSKFVGHRLQKKLEIDLPSRSVIAYDADLPNDKRRQIERMIFKPSGKAKIVIGTSALELGVDLPSLDVVVMDELPPRRCELLQRLGRVGRSFERPGLGVLCLGYSPADERLIEEPLAAVDFRNTKPLSLPLHLESVRLLAMAAAFKEWMPRLKKKNASWGDFNSALNRYFGEAPHYRDLRQQLGEVLSGLVDFDDPFWVYRGFRVSASQGKRPLIDEKTGKQVALIDDIAIFRDAHPEGVYLNHLGVSYRVKRYVGQWEVGTWESPEGVILGKYLKGLDHIVVSKEKTQAIATRGRWKDTFGLEEQQELTSGCQKPAKGILHFGIFTFLRKFDGYQEIDLNGLKKPKYVSLADVTKRFRAAVNEGESFPFLHNFSYRTKGWSWLVARVVDEQKRKELAPILGPLLETFFCDAVECSPNDLQVTFEPQGEIRVVDSTPGGNGLSEALLSGDRIATAWKPAINQIAAQGRKSKESFRRFLAEEYRVDSNVAAQEIADVVQQLADAWNG